jgi:hypothetical protein
MSSKWIAVAAAALLLSVGAARSAGASTIVTFDSHTVFDTAPNDFVESGLMFHGLQSYFVVPYDHALTNWPIEAGSTILATLPDYASADPENLLITYTVGGLNTAFNLGSVELGLGWYNPEGASFEDSVTITGHKAGCVVSGTESCTVTQVAPVAYHFASIKLLGFDNVDSVTFGPLSNQAYLGLDNIRYGVGSDMAVPEPATWAMMLLGFGGLGAALRRNRRRELRVAA